MSEDIVVVNVEERRRSLEFAIVRVVLRKGGASLVSSPIAESPLAIGVLGIADDRPGLRSRATRLVLRRGNIARKN